MAAKASLIAAWSSGDVPGRRAELVKPAATVAPKRVGPTVPTADNQTPDHRNEKASHQELTHGDPEIEVS